LPFGTGDAEPPAAMLVAVIPGLIAVALFIATVTMKPQRPRRT
jgi:hypothetical protein